MRILHLLYESQGDPFGFGGAAIRSYKVYQYLKQRHEITLLCRKYPGARNRVIQGLFHRFVGLETTDFARALLAYAFHARKFVQYHGTRYDLIIEEFSPATPLFLSRYRKRPVILQIQGYTGSYYFKKYPLFYALPLFLFEKIRPYFYDYVIWVSETTSKNYRCKCSAKGRIISNGIDRNLLTSESEEKDYILYLGRLDIHHKGLDVLFEAYRRFAENHRKVRLHIGGDGRDREKCWQMRQRLSKSLRDNVEFCGWLDNCAKKEELRQALFIVVPSRYETQGIVILEAAACQKPVIVSDIPALRYIVTKGGGLAFPPENDLRLAEQMTHLMEQPELRRKMGMRAKQWVKDLTWDKIALQFEEFLQQVVDENSPAYI